MNQTRTSIRHMPRQILLRQIIIGLIITLVVTLLLSACRFDKVDTVDLRACPFRMSEKGNVLTADLDVAFEQLQTRGCHTFKSFENKAPL